MSQKTEPLLTPPHALGDGEQEAEIDRWRSIVSNETDATERHLEPELQTTLPPLSITIIIASASALAHCHHVNTPHCTLITAHKDIRTMHSCV